MKMNNLFENYMDQPVEVSIETLSLCNAKCSFCTYPSLERIGEEMPLSVINGLIEQMSKFEHPFFFSPFKVNEPLLDARLLDILGNINRQVPLARLRLFTNGSPLTPDKMYRISALQNVEHLWVSLNSCDPGQYERIMGIRYDVTARKLDMLHGFEDFRHSVVLSKVADKDSWSNEHFVRECHARWPRFKTVLIKRDGWLGDIEAPLAMIPDAPCSRWFELSICASGVVSLCCMDGHGRFAIGDIHKQTLLEVYNSPQWRERRQKMLSRKAVFPCSTCSY